jgi:hypothetical protein
MDLTGGVELVRSREDLAQFALALRADLIEHPDEWENGSLDRFLEAFAAWTVDMAGYFANRGEQVPDQPDWQLVAKILIAASMYE